MIISEAVISKSTATDCYVENVSIEPIIIAELEFRDVQRHILATDFVERTNDAAFDKSFNRLCVNCADDILLFRVIDNSVWILVAKMFVTDPFVSAKKADLARYGFMYKRLKSGGADIFDYAGNDITLALHSADDRDFAGTNAASPATVPALVLMLILCESANKSFVDFYNATKLVNIFNQCRPDLMAHRPSCFIGAKAHSTFDLKGRDALLASQHHMDDTEPIAKRFICIFKYRPSNMGKSISIGRTLLALPMPFAGRQIINSRIATTWAMNAFRPSSSNQISSASLLIGEHSLELWHSELMDCALDF